MVLDFIYIVKKGSPFLPVIRMGDAFTILDEDRVQRTCVFNHKDRPEISGLGQRPRLDWAKIHKAMEPLGIAGQSYYLFELPQNENGVHYILVSGDYVTSDEINDENLSR